MLNNYVASFFLLVVMMKVLMNSFLNYLKQDSGVSFSPLNQQKAWFFKVIMKTQNMIESFYPWRSMITS